MNLVRPRPDAPGDAAGGVLVIGYGNTLRSDDGVGWHAAELLAADPRLAADPESGDDPRPGDAPPGGRDGRPARVEVLARHQLTPELALDLSRESLVILIDASVDDPPGAITVRSVASDADVAGGGPGASSHHVGPGELLAVALELYGAAPEAFVVSVGVADLGVGESLSLEVAAALPAVVETVVDLIAAHRRSRPASNPG